MLEEALLKKREVEKLIIDIRSGNTDAFAKLYNLYFDSAYNIALKITRNVADTEDVVQNTMIQLYNHIEELSRAHSPDAYVNRIAYNCTIDFIRKHRELLLDEDASSMLDNLTEDNREYIPHEFAETQGLRELISTCLNETLRPVIILFYYHHLSIKEIAAILEIRESAVKKRLVRGREELRKQIERADKNREMFGAMLLPMLSSIPNDDNKVIPSQRSRQKVWLRILNELEFPGALVIFPVIYEGRRTSITKPIFNDIKLLAIPTIIGLALLGLLYLKYFSPLSEADTAHMQESSDISSAIPNSASQDGEADFTGPTSETSDFEVGSPLLSATDKPNDALSVNKDADRALPAFPQEPYENEAASDLPEAVPALENEKSSDTRTPHTSTTLDDNTDYSPPAQAPPDNSAVMNPALEIQSRYLYFQRGTLISENEILAASGATAANSSGEAIALKIAGIEDVKFNETGQYHIFIQTVDHNPILRMGILIIIED